MKGFYVHIPFCIRKCAYCDFYSVPVSECAVPREVGVRTASPPLRSYIQAVISEAAAYARAVGGWTPDYVVAEQASPPVSRPSFDTLYLGGGTPSLLGPYLLGGLFAGLRGAFNLSNLVEATIEVNPESATRELLEAARDSGINRVSVGVQSLSDAELKSVGRVHNAHQAVAALKLAVSLGFKSVSADLIIGLPGQTWGTLAKSMDTVSGLGIQHVSVYCLSLEEGTPLAAAPPEGLPSDDTQADLFDRARSRLEQRGFTHYEISNFALPGHECRHNLNYWHGGEYLGLGPSAASHLDSKRSRNSPDVDAYIKDPTGQTEYVEELGPREKAAEEAMLRLRLLREGLDVIALEAKFGKKSVVDLAARLERMGGEGLLERDGERYWLPRSRVLTSNPVFAGVLGD